MKKRVLIVDDSAFARQTLREILSGEKDIDVVGAAVNGVDAIEKVLKYKPDIILLDLEMPLMDGFGFMRWLMMEKPTPVVIVSSHSNRETVFRALQAGALDFIAKPTRKASASLRKIKDELLVKLRAIDHRALHKLQGKEEIKTPPKGQKFKPEGRYSIVAIGASTGGPQAIELILKGLPPLGIPIVIGQHMPAGFTRAFAERLDRLLPWKVKEAAHGEPLRVNTVYICPGGYHMSLNDTNGVVSINLKKGSKDDKYVPSIDQLMGSVGEVFKNKAIGVILTGMGSDGKKGAEKLSRAGGYIIAESEETAIVYGMPRAVVEAGFVKKTMPLFGISSELLMLICGKEET